MRLKRSSFVPCPEGPTVGTFVDFTDETGQFGPQTRMSFDTEELMEDGRPFRVAFWISEAVNPKSNAYKFLRAMGIDADNVTDEELEALDYNDLLQRKCTLVIEHKKKTDGSIKANIANLLPLKQKGPAPGNGASRPAVRPAARSGGTATLPVEAEPEVDPFENE